MPKFVATSLDKKIQTRAEVKRPRNTKEMIKEITMYQCVCDNCGNGHTTDNGFCCWNNKGLAFEMSQEDDWHETEDGEKHICPECIINIDDDGIVTVNKTRTKP